MNQKLSDWASIAEIVGSFAVLVTLILLIVEVRGTTNAIQEQTIDAQRYAEFDRRTRLIENAGGITDLIVRTWNGEALPESEAFRVRLHYLDMLDTFEWQFGKFRAGGLPIERLNTGLWQGTMENEPGMAEAFEASKARRNPEFVNYIEEALLSQ